MSIVVNELRPGIYLDSVQLMRISAVLAERDGVEDAALMIGTESNRRIMDDAGLLADVGAEASANDLVIAVRADDLERAQSALDAADALLSGTRETGQAARVRPRSLDGALAELPDANLALISTPGEFAAREARRALARGLNVMIFSDNVSLADEVALKRDAAARNLLLMGPDCGTAYIGGVPLAFANVVEPGPIGIVAASGTGLQEVASLCSRLGGGIRHGLGVGGRDLDDEVGGLSTLAAIDLLADDPSVDRIVLISKPPGARTASRVFERLADCGKPTIACMLGLDPADAAVPDSVSVAPTLARAAELACACELADDTAQDHSFAARLAARLAPERTRIHGLFCGGTLCGEAAQILRAAGIDATQTSLRDLGDDAYTVGRPHPMIEPAVRTPHLMSALADEACAMVLLDVVLGHGAHPDPARAVVDALHAADTAIGERQTHVIASVCGTDRDPQNRSAQVRLLEDADVIVCRSNADAATLAANVARGHARR